MWKVQRAARGWWLCAVLAVAAVAVSAAAAPTEAQAQVKKVKKKKKSKSKGVSSKKAVVGLRGGVVLSGSGQTSVEGFDGSADYTDNSAFAVNAFGLFPIGNKLRVGASLWYYPTIDLDLTGSNVEDDTNDFSGADVNAMIEYSQLFQKTFRIYGYGEAGLSIWFPSETEEDAASPTGFNAALGAGLAYGVSKGFEVRGELRYQPFYSVSATTEVGGDELTSTSSGQRLMVNLGFGFGL